MPKTEVRSGQIKDATVGRSDINTATAGEAVVRKIVSGTGISLSSTGADTGTGDVTITASGGGAPAAHKTTHEVGGSDAISGSLQVTDLRIGPTPGTAGAIRLSNNQSIGSMNAAGTVTYGVIASTTSNSVMIGSGATGVTVVPNLTASGNIDVAGTFSANSLGTTPLNASYLTSGTVPDARLSTNVALENTDNAFTGYLYNNLPVDPGLYTQATAGTVDQRRWSMSAQAASWSVQATTDAYTLQAQPIICLRNGDVKIGADIYEKGRSVATGHWQAIPFSASNFSAVGGGTWTVGSAAVIANRYTLIGKTMHWSIYISWFSGSNTVAGTVTTLVIANPGFTFAGSSYSAVGYGIDAGVYTDMLVSPAGSGTINITKKNGANFTAGSPGIITAMTWEIV